MAIAKNPTARKSTAVKKTTVKAKAKSPIAKQTAQTTISTKIVTPVVPAKTEVQTPALRKKDLIDAVVLRSGIKKKDAKPVIEAMLAVLGENIALSKDMNLQPFGKIMVKKQMDKTSAVVSTVKIRQSKMFHKARPDLTISEAAE